MKNLNWKKKYLSDKSGFWYEAKIKSINWTYVVEVSYNDSFYGCYLFVNDFADEAEISNKKYKTLEQAQNFCQKHIENITNKLLKEIKNE
jgi:hypothetical protein